MKHASLYICLIAGALLTLAGILATRETKDTDLAAQ